MDRKYRLMDRKCVQAQNVNLSKYIILTLSVEVLEIFIGWNGKIKRQLLPGVTYTMRMFTKLLVNLLNSILNYYFNLLKSGGKFSNSSAQK